MKKRFKGILPRNVEFIRAADQANKPRKSYFPPGKPGHSDPRPNWTAAVKRVKPRLVTLPEKA